MLSEANLRRYLVGWINLGPFRELEDLEREQEQFANALTDADLPNLIRVGLALEAEDPHAEGGLAALFMRIIPLRRQVCVDALLGAISADAPPTLIDILGMTGAPEAAPALEDLLRTPSSLASAQAIVDALAAIGTPAAMQTLERLADQEGLDPELLSEVRLAREHPGLGRV